MRSSYQLSINLLYLPFCLDVSGDPLVLSAMAELNIEPYDEDNGTGELRYVQVMDFMETNNSCFPVSAVFILIV